MSGGGGIQDALDQLNYLRELGDGDPVEGGFVAADAALLENLRQVSGEVQTRRSTPHAEGGWRSFENARETIRNLPPEQQLQQHRAARDAVLADLAQIPIAWHDMSLRNRPPQTLLDAMTGFLVTLHNPIIQESLLVVVDDDREEEAREMFRELSGILWGFVETSSGVQGDFYATYLRYLSEHWGLDPGELERRIFEAVEEPPDAEAGAVDD